MVNGAENKRAEARTVETRESGTAERIAAVDLGTNSVRLAVADIHADHSLHLVRESKEVIRLGSGEFGGKLAEDAIRRAEAACKGFADLARGMDADPILAVATSAIREAENRDEAVERIEAASGLTFHVISGQEEGRLVHLGVVHSETLPEGRVCVIDIGGGSAEIACGDRDGADVVESVKLGAIRTSLMQPSDAEGRYSKGRLARLRDFARNTSMRAAERVREADAGTLVGTSGTIQALGQMVRRKGGERGESDRRLLRREDLTRLIARMAKMTTAERMGLPGLNPERADIIVAGAVVLEQILLGLGREEVLVSDRTLRDGLLLDYVLREDAARIAYGATPVRERSVRRMMRRFQAEQAHAETVAHLAESIFDQCRALGWHTYGEEARELLRYGALLHDVGVIISPTAHHRHGHYLVSRVSLPGFFQEEIDTIAALVLFHRKALPKPGNPVFAALRPEDQALLQDLLPVQRLADAMDRSHGSFVTGVTVETGRKGSADVTAHATVPIPYEEWAIGRMLESTPALFGHPIRFHVRVD